MPADRLTFFNVKDGWEPLCKILDRPIPDVPFPHANDGDAMKNLLATMAAKAKMRWLQISALSGVTLVGLFALSRRTGLLGS